MFSTNATGKANTRYIQSRVLESQKRNGTVNPRLQKKLETTQSWGEWFGAGLASLQNSVTQGMSTAREACHDFLGFSQSAVKLEIVNSKVLEDGRTAVVVKFCNSQRAPLGFCDEQPNQLSRLDLTTGVIPAGGKDIVFPENSAYARILIDSPQQPYTPEQLSAVVNELWGRGCAIETLSSGMLDTIQQPATESGSFVTMLNGFPVTSTVALVSGASTQVFKNLISTIEYNCNSPGTTDKDGLSRLQIYGIMMGSFTALIILSCLVVRHRQVRVSRSETLVRGVDILVNQKSVELLERNKSPVNDEEHAAAGLSTPLVGVDVNGDGYGGTSSSTHLLSGDGGHNGPETNDDFKHG